MKSDLSDCLKAAFDAMSEHHKTMAKIHKKRAAETTGGEADFHEKCHACHEAAQEKCDAASESCDSLKAAEAADIRKAVDAALNKLQPSPIHAIAPGRLVIREGSPDFSEIDSSKLDDASKSMLGV